MTASFIFLLKSLYPSLERVIFRTDQRKISRLFVSSLNTVKFLFLFFSSSSTKYVFVNKIIIVIVIIENILKNLILFNIEKYFGALRTLTQFDFLFLKILIFLTGPESHRPPRQPSFSISSYL